MRASPWGVGVSVGVGAGPALGRRGGVLTGAGVGGCVARGWRFGRRPGVRWNCFVCGVLVLVLVWARLGVWLLYISVCGCVWVLGVRRVGVGYRFIPSPNEAGR